MSCISRRQGIASLAAGLVTGLVGPGIGSRALAQAADFPNKPVTLIVPWQAGISVDILLRGIAEVAAKHLGQPVVVENKAGGSATLGPAHMAANAKPDGYTIAQITMPVLRVPHLQKVTYDPLQDFSWIIQLGGYTVGVVVPAKSEFKTFKDVVAFAKANPGKLTYTTPGPSTLNSISMEMIARKEGTTLAHVPGKGGGESAAALLGGHVMMSVESPSWAPMVASGDLRLLALLNSNRSKKWPDVPTLAEHGYDWDFNSPFGLAGPKGMDPAVVKKLHDAFKLAHDDPKVIELYDKFDFPRLYLPTAEYAAIIPKQFEAERLNLERVGLIKK
jgi:tripartite-type tricarboxylate transporter receptor subunit TctC